MSGYPEGHYEDGYGHQGQQAYPQEHGQDAYYQDEHNQGYYEQGYENGQHQQGGEAYYDESLVSHSRALLLPHTYFFF